ncbi:MAG: 1-(5-phosphoribosyl)-5-[(5-phosphoribosylamino)methylideneamino]imidazole-4-carboxamide isomerase [Candidatus Omnitrophota bacterium]
MIIIPAIDIRAKKVVRLLRGDFAKETIYSDDPAEVAKQWQAKGAKLLHIVDLDGAYFGEPKNLDVIESIKKAVSIPIEVGGGLRDDESVDRALSAGACRAIIGTRAYLDEDFIVRLIGKYKEKIAVSIDAEGKEVVAKGWRSRTLLTAPELAKKMESLGVKTIIYTNVLRDGTLESPQLDLAEEMLDAVKTDIIIAGGVSSLKDIEDIKALGKPNLYGVIVGKALYEGKLDLKKAIQVIEGV